MKLINPNYLIADHFEVQTMSKDVIEYREGGRIVEIYREWGYDPGYYTTIFLSDIKSWNDGQVVSQDELLRIKKNIDLAYQMMKGRYTFN